MRIVIFAALILYFGIVLAHSHSAPSGWRYPKDCCSDDGHECREVPCLSIKEDRDGWRYNGMVFTQPMLRPSGDGHCHACFGTNLPHCIILPNRPSS
jgi:hypothetical protein